MKSYFIVWGCIIKIFFDIEATDKNPYIAEIIESYFVKEDGEVYEFESQVREWSEEAEKIHGIREDEMHRFPEKAYAWDRLLDWFPDKFEAVVYANPQSEMGFFYYDTVALKMEIMNHLGINHECKLPIKITTTSVHTLAKQCEALGLFTAIKAKDAFRLGISTNINHADSNNKSFMQGSVYYALFGKLYRSHRSKTDTIAMIEIYQHLKKLLENKKIDTTNQLSLL